MEQEVDEREIAIDNVLLAGVMMMKSGAETYRIEDTMRRMADAQALTNSHAFVMPTGIIFSPGRPSHTKLIRIEERNTDLEKVAFINDVSRRLASGTYSIVEANERLRYLEQSSTASPLWVEMVAAAVASGSFLFLFGGGLAEVFIAMIAGCIGYGVSETLEGYSRVQFVGEFIGALCVATIVSIAFTFGVGTFLDKMILGGIMPLVPGVLITNGVRDLMAGSFISGVSKGAEALLTSFALGAGVAIVLALM